MESGGRYTDINGGKAVNGEFQTVRRDTMVRILARWFTKVW